MITPSVMVFLDMLQNQRLRRYTAYSAIFKPRGRSPQGLISDKTIGNVKVLVENVDESSDHERVENQVKNICRGSIASKIGPEGD